MLQLPHGREHRRTAALFLLNAGVGAPAQCRRQRAGRMLHASSLRGVAAPRLSVGSGLSASCARAAAPASRQRPAGGWRSATFPSTQARRALTGLYMCAFRSWGARPPSCTDSVHPAGWRRCWSAALSPSLGACSYPRSSGTQPSFSSGHAPCPAPDSGACGFRSAWDCVSGPPRARCASDHGLTASPSRVERVAGPRPPRCTPRCCAAHLARRTGGSWCAARRCVRSSARPTTPAAK